MIRIQIQSKLLVTEHFLLEGWGGELRFYDEYPHLSIQMAGANEG